MMLDLTHLPLAGKQRLDALAPSSRVVASAKPFSLCGSQDHLDTTAHARGRLGLMVPDRSENLHYVGGVDIGDGRLADQREGVGLKRVCPLLAMLRVFPSCFHAGDVA